jgi:hypothetical protein
MTVEQIADRIIARCDEAGAPVTPGGWVEMLAPNLRELIIEEIGREAPPPVKAYSVQADECGEVVFAKHGAGARRRGAAMMDLEWTDIVSCRRAPQFDCFAPGPVPELELWRGGWRFLCCECECGAGEGDGAWINNHPYCESCAPAFSANPEARP